MGWGLKGPSQNFDLRCRVVESTHRGVRATGVPRGGLRGVWISNATPRIIGARHQPFSAEEAWRNSRVRSRLLGRAPARMPATMAEAMVNGPASTVRKDQAAHIRRRTPTHNEGGNVSNSQTASTGAARPTDEQQKTAEPGKPAHFDDVTEQKRLNEAREAGIPWKKWGPYLSERQWGTVREDYSEDGNAWDYFSHDQSRSRAYRWGEDGLGGISDDKQRLCFALALWNEQRPDPQGAALRAHQQRGQSRRGRQGVLLLPRLDADALVHEVPLQVSAARVPVPRISWRRTGGGRGRSSSTSCSTRASSTTTATSTSSSSTPRTVRTTS